MQGGLEVYKGNLNTPKGKLITSQPHYQPGFDQSKVGQQAFIRTERWQVTPPHDLGRVPPDDPTFNKVNAMEPEENNWWQAAPGRDQPAPLWADPALIHKNRVLKNQNDFLHEHGEIDGVLLHRNYRTHAPKARTMMMDQPRKIPGSSKIIL